MDAIFDFFYKHDVLDIAACDEITRCRSTSDDKFD